MKFLLKLRFKFKQKSLPACMYIHDRSYLQSLLTKALAKLIHDIEHTRVYVK